MNLKSLLCCLLLLMLSVVSPAQTAPATQPNASADAAAFGALLGRLQATARETAADLSAMKIDKWKTDGQMKQQYQANSTSLQRNLTAALPEIIQKAQAAPMEIGPNFILYRNLNVVFDVLTTTVESAGAFGPKEQYEPLARDVGNLDEIRRSIAQRCEQLANNKDAQVAQMRQQLTTLQQQLATAQKSATSGSETKSSKPAKKKKPAK